MRGGSAAAATVPSRCGGAGAVQGQQLGGAGVGTLGGGRCPEPVAEEVGEKKQCSSGVELGRPLLGQGQELVEGVELQELDAGAPVDLGRTQPARQPLAGIVEEMVPLGPGNAHQRTVVSQRAEVDTPAVEPS